MTKKQELKYYFYRVVIEAIYMILMVVFFDLLFIAAPYGIEVGNVIEPPKP